MTFKEKQQAMLSDLLADRARALCGPAWWWHRLDEKIIDLKSAIAEGIRQ